MTSRLRQTQQETRDQLEQRASLPRSLDRGLLDVPGTGERVRLDVTVDGRSRQGRNSGPGLRDYGSRGERGVQTVLQQLPGENIRVYKVITGHRGEPGAPTVLRFRFRTSVTVSDEYTYIGHPGVVLIDPNGPAGQLEGHRGSPIGFLTEPVALDANSQPVTVTWTLRSRTLELRVEDRPDMAYPVVVDPTFYPRTWMAQARNGAPLLAFVGRAGQGGHESARAVAASEVAAAMTATGCAPGTPLTWIDATGDFYRRVWARVLPCLDEG
jgi:hypothetical protein